MEGRRAIEDHEQTAVGAEASALEIRQAVTVSYTTANGTAAAGSDYEPASGTVTFDAGQTSTSISVLVDGDRAGEPNENFMVNLTLAEGAVIGDGQGTRTRSVEDYDARSGTLAFNAGETSKTVAVTVRADKKFEFDEMFYLNLSGAAGAFVMDSQGVGVVRNDDR